MGLTNEELIRRYRAGEPIDGLAAAAEMTRSGMYDRLRRIGVAPRTGTDTNISDETIRQALSDHKSINAAAKALGLSRSRLTAEAVRLGLREPPPTSPTTSPRSTAKRDQSTESPSTTGPAPPPSDGGYAASAYHSNPAANPATARSANETLLASSHSLYGLDILCDHGIVETPVPQALVRLDAGIRQRRIFVPAECKHGLVHMTRVENI